MSRSSQASPATGRRRRGRPLGQAALLCALAAAIGALAAATGAAAPGTATVVLGSTATMPDPSCPELPCQAVGSVTGFQIGTDQTSNPYLVPRAGTIKAW